MFRIINIALSLLLIYLLVPLAPNLLIIQFVIDNSIHIVLHKGF